MDRFFRPKKDITAHELALIWAHVVPGLGVPVWTQAIRFTESQWAEVGRLGLWRHFSDSGAS